MNPQLNPAYLLNILMCTGAIGAFIAGAIAIYLVRRDRQHPQQSDLTASELLDHPTQPLYNQPQRDEQLNNTNRTGT